MGPVRLQVDRRRVHVDGDEVALTATEFALLTHLMRGARAGVHPRAAARRRVGLHRGGRHPHRRRPRRPAPGQARGREPDPYGARAATPRSRRTAPRARWAVHRSDRRPRRSGGGRAPAAESLASRRIAAGVPAGGGRGRGCRRAGRRAAGGGHRPDGHAEVLAQQADVVAAQLAETGGGLRAGAGMRRVVDVLAGQGVTVVVVTARGPRNAGILAPVLEEADVRRVLDGQPVSAQATSAGVRYLVEARPAPVGGFALVRTTETGPLGGGLVRRNLDRRPAGRGRGGRGRRARGRAAAGAAAAPDRDRRPPPALRPAGRAGARRAGPPRCRTSPEP